MNDSLVVGATAFVLAVLLTCAAWVVYVRGAEPPRVPPAPVVQGDDLAPQRIVLDVAQVEQIAQDAARRAVEEERARQPEQMQPRSLKASLCASPTVSAERRELLHCEEPEQ